MDRKNRIRLGLVVLEQYQRYLQIPEEEKESIFMS